MVLPRWVNDYRALNANTVLDSHPLPRIDDILNDCAKGKIWSKMDMTNSFFQTRVHPDDIHLTAVTTPLGLYEWLAMPMGLRNLPPIHQRHMTAALCQYLGKFCHIYLDDIVIWSTNVAEHTRHIDLVMKALREAQLYCNLNKCRFYLTEMDFLGHHVSAQGIEPNSSKIDRITQWPKPKSATDMCAFLGLVRYVSVFLPHLADHTAIGFRTGIPRVGFSHTAPVPAKTVPMAGTGTHRPVVFTVSNETRGTFGTRGFFAVKYLKYYIILV